MLLFLEIASVGMVLCYLYFASERRAVAWIFGIISSVLSIILFWFKHYHGSILLNAVYILQGISGYFYWKWLDPYKPPAFRTRWIYHLMIWVLCPPAALFLQKVASALGLNDLLYSDLLLACGSIAATYLEIRKDTSCWIYWMVCNLSYALLYFINPAGGEPLYLYSGLMLLLALFSAAAMRRWIKNSAQESDPSESLQQNR